MRREGRQHGWVYAVERSLVDPEGKRRAVHAVEGAATAANGGFVRAPRKPTNHSKPTGGGRAYKGGSSSAAAGKERHKFKHDEVKMYYREGADECADTDVYDIEMDA